MTGTGEVAARSWQALGTNADLLVVGGEIEVARDAVERVLAEVDLAYSRFRVDSELVAINARAGQAVVVTALLGAAIDVALRAAALTDGLCDPTVGGALRRIGYDGDFAEVVRRDGPISLHVQAIPGWRSIDFDPQTRTLRAPAGVELDLGSTGKAYAADLAAQAALTAMGRGGALVSLGGDLAVAGDSPEGGWRVLMADDSTTPPSSDGDVVAVERGAMATSSTTVRRWSRGNTVVHHLVDPRTGLPAQSPWRTVSVVAGTCADANAAATAALIRGATGPAWLEAVGLPGRFVELDGRVVRSSQWPQATL